MARACDWTRRDSATIVLGVLAGCLLLAALPCQAAPAEAYDCLTTPNGIPLKVIVKKKDAFAFANRDFTGDKQELAFFRKYFIFDKSDNGYLIGDGTVKAAVLGWVAKADVRPWHTQQVLYFVNQQEDKREPVRIWRNKEDVGDPQKPYFEEVLDREQTTEPFPVLDKDGDKIQIAFLWSADGPAKALKGEFDTGKRGDLMHGEEMKRGATAKTVTPGTTRQGAGAATAPPGSSSGSGGTTESIVDQVRRMDIVLVMDVTQSMGPYMEEVRKRLVQIVEAFGEIQVQGPPVETYIGIVAYRDYSDRNTSFMTKVLNLTKDRKAVLDFLTALTPSGGKWTNEAVCEALAEAIQTMNWGERSNRFMCLVGDAPPHTPDDKDTTELKEARTEIQNEFFGRPFEDSLARVREITKKNRIELYAMAVGNLQLTQERFKAFPEREGRFFALADSKKFITTLADELTKSSTFQKGVVQELDAVISGKQTVDSLTKEVTEYLFRVVNMTPDQVAQLRVEPIQEGWCVPDWLSANKNAVPCTYMQRRTLEAWELQLRDDLNALAEGDKSKEEAILRGVLDRQAGEGLNLHSINDIVKAGQDVTVQAPIVSDVWLNRPDLRAKANELRRKLNNLTMLLLTTGLFNRHEEGWVPLDLLPGFTGAGGANK